MYKIDFNTPQHVHFIGIGGISMSALARILMDAGFSVSGSDSARSALTEELEKSGAVISYGQRASNIGEHCEVVVYSAAIHDDNPEYAEAVRRFLPMLSRAELLGQIMGNYKRAIAVAGTHGKTTTTAMISEVIMAADLDPTISIGGILPSVGGNLRVGGKDIFITEACEYTNSFLEFRPTADIILNVEEDHLDFFKDIGDIRSSFRRFAHLLPKDGILIINSQIEDTSYFTEGLECRAVTFGMDSSADYQACNIEYDSFACASFDVMHGGVQLGRFTLGVPGVHNVSNAMAAIALAFEYGIDAEVIGKGLSAYTGTDRRFQKKGEIKGAVLVDDYAHHPTEIRASLETALSCPHRKLLVIFQPHTYTRTAAFLDEFADALSLADEVVLAEIYAAREINTIGISSADLAEKINALGKKSAFFPTFEEIEDYVYENIAEGDLLITMGAGDVYLIGENLLEREK